jgi:predicted anti-sigma-YlaC factor YlaD
MSKHVIEWLNAYLDGELKESQAQQVEEHLIACDDCRAELEALARLSSLLQEVPTPEFTAPERFAAQVSLRLPRKQERPTSKNKALEIGWWLIPVGLLGTWVFIVTATVVSSLLSTANELGLMNGLSGWLVFGSGNETWSATLGQVGVLSGNNLVWVASTEAFARISLPQLALHVSIALLYLSWMAIWWARRRRQGQEQLLEG